MWKKSEVENKRGKKVWHALTDTLTDNNPPTRSEVI